MEVEFMIRLDKFLSEMGVGTRQEVKQYIRKGKVEVDGEIAKRPELKVDETKANVTLDGERIGYASYVYYMLNKPSGVVSAKEDKREKTVIDLIKGQKRKDLFPVGRLDKDTVGLLLITNDGNLAHRLLSPKHHVDKCYFAKVQGNVTKDDAEKFPSFVIKRSPTVSLSRRPTGNRSFRFCPLIRSITVFSRLSSVADTTPDGLFNI